MTVYVYTTDSIVKAPNVDAQLHISINNRTTDAQSYRVIVWNASPNPKTPLLDTPVTVVPGNNTAVVNFTIPANANVGVYEVEIRLSSVHMAPYVQQKYTSRLGSAEFKEAVYAGEMFFDTTTAENP